MNNQYFRWDHHPNTSWNTSRNILQTPQVQRSSCEETMAELAKIRAEMANSRLEQDMVEKKRNQAELAMAQAAFSRSMADLDYSQVGLPRSHGQDEIRSPLQETMTNLEENMAELRRSQAQLMEEVNKPSQEESNLKSEVDELAFTMTKLGKCGVDLSIKEEMTPVATSYTQSKF